MEDLPFLVRLSAHDEVPSLRRRGKRGGCKFTIAGALVASKLHITEAGLRNYNRRMHEEINRVLVDHISDLLFCPTKTSVFYEDNQVLPYCLVTVHRAENTNNPRCLQNILKTLEELNTIVVFPVLEYTIITWYCYE